jgi:hypothetical protein
MRAFVFVIGFLIALTVHAQQWPSELWHEGKILLESGDTLRGLVKYDMQQDLIQFNNNKSIEAFTARKVLFFEIFDQTINQYRQIYSLPFTTANGYKTPIFFELLSEGKLTLLARESIEYRTYSSPYYFGSYNRLVLVYRFYFLNEKGVITEFKGKKSDLLDMMGKYAKEVENFMRVNKLNIDDRHGFTKVIAYYNSLYL